MRTALAVLLFLAAIVGGVYVGGYLMLYAGIVNIIAGATATTVNGGLVAWGIIQVFVLWELLGGLTFFVIATIAAIVGGWIMPLKWIANRRRKRKLRA